MTTTPAPLIQHFGLQLRLKPEVTPKPEFDLLAITCKMLHFYETPEIMKRGDK